MTVSEICENTRHEILEVLAKYKASFESAKDFAELEKTRSVLESDLEKIFRDGRWKLREEVFREKYHFLENFAFEEM